MVKKTRSFNMKIRSERKKAEKQIEEQLTDEKQHQTVLGRVTNLNQPIDKKRRFPNSGKSFHLDRLNKSVKWIQPA